jgi:hypothetical protein
VEDPLPVEETTKTTAQRAPFWWKKCQKLLVKEATKAITQRARFKSKKSLKQLRGGAVSL